MIDDVKSYIIQRKYDEFRVFNLAKSLSKFLKVYFFEKFNYQKN